MTKDDLNKQLSNILRIAVPTDCVNRYETIVLCKTNVMGQFLGQSAPKFHTSVSHHFLQMTSIYIGTWSNC